MTSGRGAERRPPGPATPDRPSTGRPSPDHAAFDHHASDRPTPLRLARVHLRLGSLSLARAELESLAGRERLDEDALLDLAEVRWRTGDLAGAGEAANAVLDRGHDDPVALVIAAEAVAAQGRPGEARRLAGRALEAADVSFDELFAGMPRSPIWPGQAVAIADLPSDAGHPSAGRPPTTPSAVPSATEEHRERRGRRADDVEVTGTPASAAAAEAFAGGHAALAADDEAQAALQLGLALRLEPGYAQAILDAIEERPEIEPALALVAGDALRLLGRESDARAAWDRARGIPAGGAAGSTGGGGSLGAREGSAADADDDPADG